MIAAEFDLSPQQLHMLRMLHERETLPMGQIAELLYCDASNVTLLVDRLEQRGLIERRPDPADRRVKQIAVTAAGRKLQHKVLERLYEPPAGIERLPATEQKALRDLLVKASELHRADD
ncbi:MAG: MarR family transcriptional regulator [Actinobacteria bacterium]|nr:MarR family transcriptional regulator [Actinomycetota bacterium]